MKLRTDHILDQAQIAPTPNRGGRITPRFIVMHYTASDSTRSAVRTLTSENSRVSAHLVITPDGEVYQLAPFNIKTWHAGPSTHMGYHGLNSHSIGIELVNMGWVRKDGAGRYYRDNLTYTPAGNINMIAEPHSRVGSGMLYWPTYPEEQLSVTETITKLLIAKYPIVDIVSHEEIDTRGWKTDPGPAFPMRRFKMLLNEREADHDQYEVTASKLNVRTGPGLFDKIGSLDKGDVITILERRGDWARITSDGWVHAGYLRRV